MYCKFTLYIAPGLYLVHISVQIYLNFKKILNRDVFHLKLTNHRLFINVSPVKSLSNTAFYSMYNVRFLYFQLYYIIKNKLSIM